MSGEARTRKQPQGAVLSEPDTERQLLGVCIAHESTFFEFIEKVRSDFFAMPHHQRIWMAMVELAENGKSLRVATITAFYKGRPDDTFDLTAYLHQLVYDAPPQSMAGEYVDMIVGMAARRRIIEAVDRVKAIAVSADHGTAIEDIVDQAISEIGAAASGADANERMRSIGEWSGELVKRITPAVRNLKESPIGYSSGIRAVDEVMGRILPEKLYAIAALSSVGKSSLLRQILKNIALTEIDRARSSGGLPKWGYLASLEMTGRDNAVREISAMCGLSAASIEQGEINPGELDAVRSAAEALCNLPIMIDEKPRLTIEDVRSRAMQVRRRKGGLSFIAIDHLLLLRPTGKRDDMFALMETASMDAKNLAKEFEVPVFVLLQLKDSVYERPGGRPINADIFGGRAIERAADSLIFLHRPEIILQTRRPEDKASEKYQKWLAEYESKKGVAEVYNGKRRSGRRGESRPLTFEAKIMDFRDVDYSPML